MQTYSSFFLPFLAATALANPVPRESLYTDTYNDITDLLSSPTPFCPPLALLFARGTFDSGNVGVWVGPPLITSLQSLLPSPSSLAAQGVSGTSYPATLSSYLTSGGSDSGAASLASTITSYTTACPSSAVIVSGWSQGALVAHKALALLSTSSPDTLAQIAGVVTFGDPWHLFSNASLPAAIDASTVKGYCFDGALAFDPLCAPLPAGYDVPDSLEGVTKPFLGLPSVAHGAQQVEAAASLVARFPGQLVASWGSFVGDLTGGEWLRLALTPQHFEYGNDGVAAEAAGFIRGLPLVKKALGE